MTATLRMHADGKVTIPGKLSAKVGLFRGGLLEARADRGRIVLTPKSPKRATGDERDEYTPAQRRYINRRLDASEAEYRQGRYHGPFETPEAAIQFLKESAKSRAKSKRTKTGA